MKSQTSVAASMLTAVSPPIARHASVVRDGKNRDVRAHQVVVHGVRKTIHDSEVKTVFVLRPGVGAVFQRVDLVEHFRSKGVRREWAAGAVPEVRFADFRFRLGNDLYAESAHSALRRARACAHGRAFVAPVRSASRRRSNSCRQASETERSSVPSMLSISAAATAERSSAERPSTSPSRWSTRAFMQGHSSTWHVSAPRSRPPCCSPSPPTPRLVHAVRRKQRKVNHVTSRRRS